MTLYTTTRRAFEPQFMRRADMYEPRHQVLLSEVPEGRVSLSCLCKGWPGAPMGIGSGPKGLHPRKPKGSAALHLDGCPHSDAPNPSAALGAPSGSFSEDGGQFVVSFDALFPERTPASGSGGTWTATSGDPMLSLTWMLLQRAGLNVIHPLALPSDPFRHLLSTASEIQVKNGPVRARLDSILLAPIPDFDANYEKLKQAHKTGTPLLLASLMPPINSAGSGVVALKSIFGPTANLWPKDLAKALKKYRMAASRWKKGGQVLMVAYAEPATKIEDDPEGKTAYAKIKRIALLPVTPWLTPIPTDLIEKRCAEAQRTCDVFVVTPDEDPLLTPSPVRK